MDGPCTVLSKKWYLHCNNRALQVGAREYTFFITCLFIITMCRWLYISTFIIVMIVIYASLLPHSFRVSFLFVHSLFYVLNGCAAIALFRILCFSGRYSTVYNWMLYLAGNHESTSSAESAFGISICPWQPRKHWTLNQFWLNVGPSSLTLAQHSVKIGSTSRVCWESISECE